MRTLTTPTQIDFSAIAGRLGDPFALSVKSGLEDLEFSDYGRSQYFASGWWIVPGVLAFGVLLVSLT